LTINSQHQHPVNIPALDLYPLRADIHAPSDPQCARAVVLINAATGVKRQYYFAYAKYLAGQGFWVITYDYRGIGDSRPGRLRHFEADFLDWGQRDFAGVIDFARRHWPELPLFVVGHSIGGTILGMAPNNEEISAAITVGAQTAYYRDWPLPARFRLYLLWHLLLPALTRYCGYFPGRYLGMLEDLPRGVINQWHARRLDPDFERQLYTATNRLYYDALTCPVLAIGLGDDPIGSPPALARLHRLFRQAPVEMRIIHPADIGEKRIDHFGFFRRRFEANLWRKTVEWMRVELEK